MRNIRVITVTGLMVAVCAVCSQISLPLPFSPVPLTLQTLAVMLTALLLGGNYGTLAIAVYVLAGAIGLPVFAQGLSGLGVVAGPTGGFLIAFIPAVAVIGFSKGKLVQGKRWLSYVIACLLGLLIIYIFGVLRLAAVTGMSFSAAIIAGALPYLPLEIIKTFLAVRIVLAVEKSGFSMAKK